MQVRIWKTTLALGLVVAAVAACGSQVDRQEIYAARGLGGGASDLRRTTGGVGARASIGEGLPGAGNDTSTVAGEVGGGGGQGSGEGVGPGGQSSDGGASGKREASDVGITPDSITVGLVASLSGPIAGLWNTAVYAMDSFVREVNLAGGVDGRKIILKIVDDGFDSGRNAAAVRELADQVFVFLGSASGADAGGAGIIRAKSIPDFGSALSPQRAANPTYVHLGSSGNEEGRHDNLPMYAKGLGVKKMGYIYFSNDVAVTEAKAWRKAYESVGIQTCYDTQVQFVEPDYTVHAVALQRNGCDGAYVVIDTNSSAKLQAAIYRQQWKPTFMLYNYTAYDDNFARLAGGPEVAEGVYAWLWQAFADEPIPEMQRYVAALKKYYPNADPKGYNAAPNWADGLLFLKALKAVGPNPTRSRLMEEVAKIRNYDAEGMMPPYPDATKRIRQPCIHIARFTKGAWKQAWPSSGWDCTGRLVK